MIILMLWTHGPWVSTRILNTNLIIVIMKTRSIRRIRLLTKYLLVKMINWTMLTLNLVITFITIVSLCRVLDRFFLSRITQWNNRKRKKGRILALKAHTMANGLRLQIPKKKIIKLFENIPPNTLTRSGAIP